MMVAIVAPHCRLRNSLRTGLQTWIDEVIRSVQVNHDQQLTVQISMKTQVTLRILGGSHSASQN